MDKAASFEIDHDIPANVQKGIRPLLAAAYIVALIFLVWPGMLNAQYIMFYDTEGYLRVGAAAIQKLTGFQSQWTVSLLESSHMEGLAAGKKDIASDAFISSARSVYYGIVLYAGTVLGSLWAITFGQGIVVLASISFVVNKIVGPGTFCAPFLIIALAVATPLPFFVCYLMPDVFTGLTILAIAVLATYALELTVLQRRFWLLLLVVSVAFHSSHLILLMLIGGGMVLVSYLKRWPERQRLMAMFGLAITCGIASHLIFGAAVKAYYGHWPTRPPFLMARVISDGPGLKYLQSTCPENKFKICQFLTVLPTGNDEFLWSRDPAKGVFAIANDELKQQLASEEIPLVVKSITFDFFGQLKASSLNAVEQFSRFGLGEFAYTDSMRKILLDSMPENQRSNFLATKFFRDAFPIAIPNLLIHCSVIFSIVFLIGAWAWSRKHRLTAVGRTPFMRLAVITLIGVATNALVVGVLSTPHDRYQARVIWLLPMIAVLAYLQIRNKTNLRERDAS